MEDKAGWHGKAPNDEQTQQALDELEAAKGLLIAAFGLASADSAAGAAASGALGIASEVSDAVSEIDGR